MIFSTYDSYSSSIVQIEVTRAIIQEFTVFHSDFVLGHFHEKPAFCEVMIGSSEKFDNVSVHACSKTNVGGGLLYLFIIHSLELLNFSVKTGIPVVWKSFSNLCTPAVLKHILYVRLKSCPYSTLSYGRLAQQVYSVEDCTCWLLQATTRRSFSPD